MISNRCVIIGSGSSIRTDWESKIEDLPIWNILKNEVTIGINWSFHWLIPTIHLFGDYKFYHTEYDNLKKLSLMVTTKDGYYQRPDHQPFTENLFFLPRCKAKKYLKIGDKKEGMHPYYWGNKSWKQGFYHSQLSGLLALTFAIHGLNAKEIFLLGFDACEIEGHTHFYDDTNIGTYKFDNHTYSGVGKDDRGFYKTGNYNKTEELNNFWFKPFEQEWNNGIKIWNVSPQSKINNFIKISYKTFYTMLLNNKIKINQSEIQTKIRNLLYVKNCK